MAEHSPAPTPARGAYGFALYLACTSAFFLYLVWAIIPDFIIHSLGFTYYPQKYWAVALPVYVLMALALFAFLLYPALNQLLTPDLDSITTIMDNHSHKLEEPHNITSNDCRRVPPAADMDISNVCRTLYLR